MSSTSTNSLAEVLNQLGNDLTSLGQMLTRVGPIIQSLSSNSEVMNIISEVTSVISKVSTVFKVPRKYGLKVGGSKWRAAPKISLPFHHTSTPTIDLRPQCPPVYDQGQLGSCTANALAFTYQFDEMRQKEPREFVPSRLFIYYNERKMEGDVAEDNGAEIHDGVTSMKSYGVCSETTWPYNVDQFSVEPPSTCYDQAKSERVLEAHALNQNFDDMYHVLSSGFPFAVGIVVYPGLESDSAAKTGNVPMPHFWEKSLGGHAIACVGWDDTKQHWIMRNSWGADWGDHGYFTLPKAYLLDSNLASDFWVVGSIEHN